MNPLWIDRLGNWNPQFLRECRGRLKTRSLIVAIAGSIIVQTLLLMGFNQIRGYSDQTPQENWLNLFRSLTWVFPYFLFLSGSYMLISDVTQEERRGTLNFIRLTPRTSQSILLGKMLGVPILPYLSIILLIPLHMVTAINAGVSLAFMVSYYLILGVSAFFLFSFALLVASLNTQALAQQSTAAISFSGLTFLLFTPLFMVWNLNTTWSSFRDLLERNSYRENAGLQWLYLPIADNFWIAHLFLLLNLAIATWGIWQVLRRRFYNPSSTTLSKYQSYALVAYTQILLFGFVVKTPTAPALVVVETLNFGLGLFIISAITTKRQALLDWLRFEQKNLGDWLWSEKSPAPIAIGINLIIINGIWIPWLLLTASSSSLESNKINLGLGLLSLGSQAFVILIYALIGQLILLQPIQRPVTWAIGTIAALFFLPAMFLLVLTITPDKSPATWVFFGYFWTILAVDQPKSFILPLLCQLVIGGGLGIWLVNQLRSLQAPKA